MPYICDHECLMDFFYIKAFTREYDEKTDSMVEKPCTLCIKRCPECEGIESINKVND